MHAGVVGHALRIAKYTLVALVIITPIRIFVAQPFIVQGASMTPTIDPREYLVIDQISYRMEEPRRGDVIIFRYPLDPQVYYVKRIIGLPREKVEIRAGVVSIEDANGARKTLAEPYAAGMGADSVTTTLREGEYFVMGDNRAASSDSRVWGPLQERYIIGRALARLYPLNEMTLFPGFFAHTED